MADRPFRAPDRSLYFTSALPGIGGSIKATPEDFLVEEIPAYPASGEGDHLFLTVEKRGISTQEMVRRVARALSLPKTEIGVAGQKDQQAVARQLISVPATNPALASSLALDGVRVLSAVRHRHKLRTGHLRGNRFTVAVRGVAEGALDRARAIFEALAIAWLPNFFGAQRFGRLDENVATGRALVRGETHVNDRFKRRFLVSAYQSFLFNRFLAARMQRGELHRALDGDVLQKTQTGGLFACEAAEVEAAQARLDAREVVPTGPMYGHKMMRPLAVSTAEAHEQAILDEEGLAAEVFARFGKLAEGTRRPLLARIEAPSLAQVDDRLVISFALQSGTYATVLLEELMKPDAPIAFGGEPAFD